LTQATFTPLAKAGWQAPTELLLRELELVVLDVTVDVALDVTIDEAAEVDVVEAALVVRLDREDAVADPLEASELDVPALPDAVERPGALVDVERPEVAAPAPRPSCEPLGPALLPPFASWNPGPSPGLPHPATTAKTSTHPDELRIPMQEDQKPSSDRAAQ
jgi:hypothetical protein